MRHNEGANQGIRKRMKKRKQVIDDVEVELSKTAIELMTLVGVL